MSTALFSATGWLTFMSSWRPGMQALRKNIGASGSESGPTHPELARMRCGFWSLDSVHSSLTIEGPLYAGMMMAYFGTLAGPAIPRRRV